MLLGELWRPEDSMMPALLSSPVVGDSILIVRPWDLRLLFSTWAWPRLPAEPCGRVLYSDRHRSVWSPNECFLGFTVFVEFLLVLCSSFSIEIFFRLFEPFTATVYIKKDWIGAKYYRKGSGERYFIILIDISLNLYMLYIHTSVGFFSLLVLFCTGRGRVWEYQGSRWDLDSELSLSISMWFCRTILGLVRLAAPTAATAPAVPWSSSPFTRDDQSSDIFSITDMIY